MRARRCHPAENLKSTGPRPAFDSRVMSTSASAHSEVHIVAAAAWTISSPRGFASLSCHKIRQVSPLSTACWKRSTRVPTQRRKSSCGGWMTGVAVMASARATVRAAAIQYLLVRLPPAIAVNAWRASGLRTTLVGHRGSVHAVACFVLHGEPHAITGAYDQTARVWNLARGTLVATMKTRNKTVTAITCMNVDGQPQAVTCGDDSVLQVWDLTDFSERVALIAHADSVGGIANTSIGGIPHVLTTGNDAVARLWNLTEAIANPSLTSSASPISAITTAQTGERHYAITGHWDGTVKVWDAADGAILATLTGHTLLVTDLATAVIEGRPHLISGGGAFPTPWRTDGDWILRLWDLTDFTLRAAWPFPRQNSIKAISCITIDKRPHAIVGAGPNAWVQDLTNGSIRAMLTDGTRSVRAIACTNIAGRPYGIICIGYPREPAGSQPVLQLWDLTENCISATKTVGTSIIHFADLNGQPHAIFSSGQSMWLWNLTNRDLRPTLAGQAIRAWTIAHSKVDRRPRIISIGESATMKVWDPELDRLEETIALPMPARNIAAIGSDIMLGLSHDILLLAPSEQYSA